MVLGIFKTGFYLESHNLSRQQINILELCFITLLTWQIRAGGRVEAVNHSVKSEVSSQPLLRWAAWS